MPGVSRSRPPGPRSTPSSGTDHSARTTGERGNAAALDSAGLGGGMGVDPPWLEELRAVAPPSEQSSGGAWGEVEQRARTAGTIEEDPGRHDWPEGGGTANGSPLAQRLDQLRTRLESNQLEGLEDAVHALADEARALQAQGVGDAAALQEVISAAGALWGEARKAKAGQLGITDRGAADLSRMAQAASRPWYSQPMGKCYRAVAGFDASSYTNRAGGRWKQLADRIPQSHGMWAVSFAHWLQETSHGQRAAKELGFEIRESDGRTRLGDYLAAHPELKGSIVVIPYGQQGTASREWNAAANYGNAKWGAGVGDISVVTAISDKGATYVADGKIPHDKATMWWVVYPK